MDRFNEGMCKVRGHKIKICVKKASIIAASAFCLLSLSGCEVLKKLSEPDNAQTIPPIVKPVNLCDTPEQIEDFAEFCQFEYWLTYLLEVMPMTWQERSENIEILGDDTVSLVRKSLLSQGTETPYQNRLRAQNWILKISNKASDDMRFLLKDVVFNNSKQLLEFESAITILSRVNVRQEKAIQELQTKLEERQKEIEKQQSQVEQLLKIESDLINQNR